MLERALPISHSEIAVGQTRWSATARKLMQDIWARVQRLLRALVDFFASGGPLS